MELVFMELHSSTIQNKSVVCFLYTNSVAAQSALVARIRSPIASDTPSVKTTRNALHKFSTMFFLAHDICRSPVSACRSGYVAIWQPIGFYKTPQRAVTLPYRDRAVP